MKTSYIIALLLVLLSSHMVQDKQPTQDKQPAPDKQTQTAKPELLRTGEYTEWSYGPESSSARTGVIAPDGSSLTIFDYVSKSEKRISELMKNCTKDALSVVEDSKIPFGKGKGKGRRTLAVFRDSEGHESAVLCRSENKNMLTMIHGKTVEHVLGLERSSFPK